MTPAPPATTPRRLADAYVHDLAELDPQVAGSLGTHPHDDRVPDLSPAGFRARAELAARVLRDLDALEDRAGDAGAPDDRERRCARLLRSHLASVIEMVEAGDHLSGIRNIFGAPQRVRMLFTMMPTASERDWRAVASRMARVPDALGSWTASLREGVQQGVLTTSRQVDTMIDLLGEWTDTRWFHGFVADGPAALEAELSAAADAAHEATEGLRTYLREDYRPATAGVPDAVGEESYRRHARSWLGSDIDPAATYAWGWEEVGRIAAQMREVAEQILPGSTPLQAMRHLDEHGTTVHGVEEVRQALQERMDRIIADLDGVHVDIAEPIRRVEAMIAPPGSAAAPYYSPPSLDFARPGRTWLPTLGRTSFPLYDLISTWHHEGVPGHHLQLAQWVHIAPDLSTFQTTIGANSAVTEGWALYAERLMDELGYLDLEARMGYLDSQMMRAIRVVIDIGMHLELTIPDDSPLAPGRTWTPELAREFFAMHSGRPADFIDSEIVRYLGWPAQAISFKLGERAWLNGRARARAAASERGEAFDLRAWHMAGLSLGALGLADLEDELARL